MTNEQRHHPRNLSVSFFLYTLQCDFQDKDRRRWKVTLERLTHGLSRDTRRSTSDRWAICTFPTLSIERSDSIPSGGWPKAPRCDYTEEETRGEEHSPPKCKRRVQPPARTNQTPQVLASRDDVNRCESRCFHRGAFTPSFPATPRTTIP